MGEFRGLLSVGDHYTAGQPGAYLRQYLCRLYFAKRRVNEQPFVTAIDTCAENPDGSLDMALIQSIALPHEGTALEHLFADCPDVTIHAYRGSMMERYAADHNLRFQALDD